MVVDCIDERRQGKRDEEEKPVTKHEKSFVSREPVTSIRHIIMSKPQEGRWFALASCYDA